MTDEQQTSILNQAIRSSLADKAPDRRKQGALNLEVGIRGLLRAPSSGGTQSHREHLSRIIRCLVDEFCSSAFPARRKGGLIGLSSTVIALEHRFVQFHIRQILPPVLACFSDEDPSVRYSACESFYNIAKIARSGVLEQFGDIFDGLCHICNDHDRSVKEGANCVDRLVRDIATECREFNSAAYIPMLTTRLRQRNTCVRQLVLGWIMVLDSVPHVGMIAFLPRYLEGLFGILASPKREIRADAEDCLTDWLAEIKSCAVDRPARARRAAACAVETVARCCGEEEDTNVRLRALHWMLELVRMQIDLEFSGTTQPESTNRGGGVVGDDTAASATNPSSAVPRWTVSALNLSRSVTPVIASPRESCACLMGKAEGEGLRHMLPILLSGAFRCLDDAETEIKQCGEQANAQLRFAAQSMGVDVPVEALVGVILCTMRETRENNSSSGATTAANKDSAGSDERSERRGGAVVLGQCLLWLQMLLTQSPARVLHSAVRDKVLDAAFEVTDEKDMDVVTVALRFIASIASAAETEPLVAATAPAAMDGELAAKSEAEVTESSPEGHGKAQNGGSILEDICCRMIHMLSKEGDEKVILSLGARAVGHLCDGVGAELFFAKAARMMLQNSAGRVSEPSRRVVRVMHRALLTARETSRLRARLRADAETGYLGSNTGDGVVGGCDTSNCGTDGNEKGEVGDDSNAIVHIDGKDSRRRSERSLPMEFLQAWLPCPVCAIGLAMWLHWFELASAFTARLAFVELTTDLEEQLDLLIDILESPIFMRVRLQLLDARRRPGPLRAVQGLLALRPQVRRLDARLGVVTTGLLLDKVVTAPRRPPPRRNSGVDRQTAKAASVNQALLTRFGATVEAHGWSRVLM
eukprot:TRINITY_DN56003_c0_g1_i1.p1 TRINITY_DN56003_c0_g1~~TRINITY_DN56003_c0_g1_i1.p1  ORF type:complete len:871 (+),score=126.70 TRINITY_DN56003_c0_g1_i1:352-2964(+)